MPTSERPRPGPRHETPKPPRSTLAQAVGGLPLPPRVGKPPASRVSKPLGASPAKPSAAKPRPANPAKPASDERHGASVAGRLGAFSPKRPSLSSVQSEPPRRH